MEAQLNPSAAEEETGESLQLVLVSLRLLRELISKKAQGPQHLKTNRRGFGLAFIGMRTVYRTCASTHTQARVHAHQYTYTHKHKDEI